jgi:hypothetical protein
LKVIAYPVQETPGMAQIGRVTVVAPGGVGRPIPPLSGRTTIWGETPVEVADKDVWGLKVTASVGTTISGRLVFEGGREIPKTLTTSGIQVYSADGSPLPGALVPIARVEDDGRFETVGFPDGKYGVLLNPPISGWIIKSVTAAGREVLGSSFDLSDARNGGVTITLTDRFAGVSGTVRDSSGKVVPGASVYRFPGDRRFWMDFGPTSWRLEAMRADNFGKYTSSGIVPPGDYFIAATASPIDDWQNPANLQALATRAIRVRIETGQTVVRDLTLPSVK